MAVRAGFEPATLPLTGACTTAVLANNEMVPEARLEFARQKPPVSKAGRVCQFHHSGFKMAPVAGLAPASFRGALTVR